MVCFVITYMAFYGHVFTIDLIALDRLPSSGKELEMSNPKEMCVKSEEEESRQERKGADSKKKMEERAV